MRRPFCRELGLFRSVTFGALLWMALAVPAKALGQPEGEAHPPPSRNGPGDAAPSTPAQATPVPARPKSPARSPSAWIVAVLPPKVGDAVSGALNERFRKAACRAFTRAGHLVVADERTGTVLLRHPLWSECRLGPCLEELASDLRADLLVWSLVRRDEVGKNYEYEMRLVDSLGRTRWTDRGRCDICTLGEAVAGFAALAAKAAAALGPKPRPVEPRCPAACGRGRRCRAGKCVAVPRKPARKTLARKLRARPSSPRPARPVARARRPVRRPRPAWLARPPWGQFALVVAGVAAAAAVAGGVLLGIDDEPTCSRPRADVTCPERYDTRAAGIGFLTVSALGVVGSAVLGYLWWRHRGERPASRRVDLQVTGVGARALWRF